MKYIEEKASSIQRQIWLARSLGLSTDYRIAYYYELSKSVEASDMEMALGQLLDAHEILRTILVSDAEGLKQRIFWQCKPPVTWIERQQPSLEAVVVEKALRAEGLSEKDTSIHFYGCKDNNNKAKGIILLADHCVADQETFEILRSDLETLLNNGRLDWKERLQYADYAEWEEQIEAQRVFRDNGQKVTEAIGMKQDAEEKEEDVISIVLHSGHEKKESTGGRATIQRKLGEKRVRHLSNVAAKTGSTHYQILLKLVQICLCRWRGMESCAVSTPISRRTQEEFSKVAGPLLRVETLKHQQHTEFSLQEHLRILQEDVLNRISDDTNTGSRKSTVKEDLDRVSQRKEVFLTVEAKKRKDRRNPHRNEKQIRVEGRPISLRNKSAGILLINILIDEAQPDLIIETKYDPDSLTGEEIQAFLCDIERVGDGLMAAPDVPLWQVFWGLGAREERREETANKHKVAHYEDTASMAELLQRLQQVSCHYSDHLCIIDRGAGGKGEMKYSYEDVWKAAEVLSAELIRNNVRQGDYVGIATRGLSTYVVSFIASLRVGAVCVPLEKEEFPRGKEPVRDYPIISHWIISDEHNNDEEQEQNHSTKESVVESILKGDHACPFPEDLPRIESVRSAAYLMFTSGTTGNPKGVVIPAGGLLKLGDEFKERGWNTGTRMLCAANRGFDASTFEIWATLLNGGTLVQGLKDEVINPDRLAQLIDRYGITAAWLTKTVFDLIAQLKPDSLMGLADLIIGGEALSANVVESFLQRSKGRLCLWNGYGPTETTTFATVDSLSLDQEGKLNPILLGREMAGNSLHILGPDLEKLPIGSIGEAYISGAGLACGYLNNARATATTFIPDPYSEEPGKRMYRTGDFFQIMAKGRYRYLGRRDKLVKIRGFRVSTSTIEEQLLKIKGVAKASVTARQHNQGKQLIAFIKRKDNETLTAIEIRSQLRGHLPEYMHPTVIKMVKEIPITQNGKVDLQALTDSLIDESASRVTEGDTQATPGSNYTRIMHAIWAEVLDKAQIPLSESIYVHGADSLSFIRCCILLGERGVSVTPQELIDYASIADQAEVVQRLASEQEATRNGVSSLTWYQECLNRLAAQNRTISGIVYSSFPVSKEYDAIAVGMALFRIFSLHPTLDWNSYNPVFSRSGETTNQSIGVVQMSEIESLEELDQLLIPTIADDLKSHNCPIRAYVAQGTGLNYVAIGIDNLVCGMASLASITYKVAHWLSFRGDNDWDWNLFGKPLKEQQTAIGETTYAYEIMAEAYSKALVETKSNGCETYGDVFINTEGFHDTINERSTQPARIIKIGSYANLIKKEKQAIAKIILGLLEQDAGEVFRTIINDNATPLVEDGSENSEKTSQCLLIHTYRNRETRVISKFDWKTMLQLSTEPSTISICINHPNVGYETKKESNDTIPVSKANTITKSTKLIGVVNCLNDSNSRWSVSCISPLIEDITCYQGLATSTQNQIALSGIYINRVDPAPDKDNYIRVIAHEIAETLQANPPNAVLGYSFGGVIAAETCAFLHQFTGEVLKLIIIDTLCPSMLREYGHSFPVYDIKSWTERVIQMRTAYIDGEISGSRYRNKLRGEAYNPEALGLLQREGIISTAETWESFNQYLQNGLRQYEAYRSYTPTPLQIPCLIARAGEQEEAIKKILNANGKLEMLGWDNYLRGQVTTIKLKGDHVSMIRGKDKKDNAQVLAKSILRFLQPNGKS